MKLRKAVISLGLIEFAVIGCNHLLLNGYFNSI